MRGKRSKLLRAICDYDVELNVDREYVAKKDNLTTVLCTGKRPLYKFLKWRIKRRRQGLSG